MKNLILTISTVFMLLLTLLLGSIFSADKSHRRLQENVVSILPKDKAFINTSEVLKMMQIRDSSAIDVSYFEKELEKNKYISKAEVYQDLNGRLVAEVTQYKPIARVFGRTSYYIDEEGKKRPLSNHYTENVVLVFGNIDDKQQKNIVQWAQKINSDKILKNIVSEIHVKPYGYSVRVKDIPAKFILNNSRPEAQLNKLKTMYVYLIKQHKKNKYQQIDLRYAKQAVCK